MYTPINSTFSIIDALLVAAISVLLVFLVLITIIFITHLGSKIIIYNDNKNKIIPHSQNKLLDEDEDAVAATIVASIDFYKETKKYAKVVSITRSKEE